MDELKKFRTRWRRWLGNKTRSDRPYWIDLLDTSWVGWAHNVCEDAGLDYVYLGHAAPREVVKQRFLDAINHATMPDLYRLDSIYCSKKYGF